MANTVRDLPKLTTVTTSGGAAFSNIVGGLDDASSITLFLASSAVAGTSGATVLVSGWDPLQPKVTFNMTSSQFVTAGSVTSSLTAVVLSNVSFRSLQLSFTGTSSFPGEVLAWVSKQISV